MPGDRADQRLGRHLVRHIRDVRREVVRGGFAAAVGAERAQRRRHRLEHVGGERVGQVRRQHGVEQQPLDMVRMRERIGERELRSVRDAEEGDLVDAERLAHGLHILGVVAGAVEVARRPDLRRARRGGGPLCVGGVGGLQGGAVQQAGVAGATVVVGDERVPGEEEVVEVDSRRIAERVAARRALARPARDQEDRAARRSGCLKDLDVERDRARHDAGPVERDDHVGAEDAGRLAARHHCLRALARGEASPVVRRQPLQERRAQLARRDSRRVRAPRRRGG